MKLSKLLNDKTSRIDNMKGVPHEKKENNGTITGYDPDFLGRFRLRSFSLC